MKIKVSRFPMRYREAGICFIVMPDVVGKVLMGRIYSVSLISFNSTSLFTMA